jgi:hypothetical protein
LIALFGGGISASERVAHSSANKSAPIVKPKPNPILRFVAAADARDRETVKDVCELLISPQPRVARFAANWLCRLSPERQTGVREDDFLGPVGVMSVRNVRERLIEFVVCPAAPLTRYLEVQWSTHRMRQLLDESEHFGQIGVAARQIWSNNTPIIVTYERLNGAIGP